MDIALGNVGDVASKQPPLPVLPPDWFHRIVDDPVNFISISLAIIAVILGLIPLVLWVFERKRSRLLDQTVKEFAILERLKELQVERERQNEKSEARRQKLEEEARAMREDVEMRLPNAALVAYYENTIPQLELQILDFGTRLQAMRESLNKILGTEKVMNSKVQEILADQISKSVGARRTLEQQQLLLVLATSMITVIVTVAPYPISILAATIPVIATVWICFAMVATARVAFPDNRFLASRLLVPKALAFVLAGFFIVTVLVGSFLWLFLRHMD